MKLTYGLFGILAFLSYFTAVIAGGMMIPGYSHLNQAISELEPLIKGQSKIYLDLLFGAYNLFTAGFGIGLFLYWMKRKRSSAVVLSAALFLTGLFGILMLLFPMDINGTQATLKGMIHILLAGLTAPLTILSAVLGFFVYRESQWMKFYSLITGILIFFFGIATVIFASHQMKAGFGLLERLTIGSFILYLLISGCFYLSGKAPKLRKPMKPRPF